MALNLPSYLVKAILSYLQGRSFKASFQAATSSRRGMRAGLAQWRLISPVLLSLYVNYMPVLSNHVEVAVYADDTAFIATSRKPSAACQIPGSLPRRLRTLAEKMVDRHQRFE